MALEELFEQAERALGAPGRLGVYFTDFKQRGEWRAHEEFPAASVIKVPILIEVLRLCQAGALSLDGTKVKLRDKDRVGGAGVLQEMHTGLTVTLRDLVTLMIVVSDNIASNLCIDQGGGLETLTEAFRSRLHLEKTVLGRKFMVEPDSPLNKNFTCPLDMARCLEGLRNGRFLDAAHRALAIDILSRQQYREKIPLLLPEGVTVASKTGEISGVRHDMALVLHPRRPYILVTLTRQVPDILQADRVIASLSRTVWDHVSASSAPRAGTG